MWGIEREEMGVMRVVGVVVLGVVEGLVEIWFVGKVVREERGKGFVYVVGEVFVCG